jgi:hypothetical protein
MAAALAWAASTGMLEVWRRSLGKLLLWMADNLDKVRLPRVFGGFKVFGALSGMLRSLVHTVDSYLAEAVLWSGKAAATFFHFFLSINLWIAREIADLAGDVWHAISSTTTTTVNHVTKVVTHTVVKPLTKSVTVVTKTSVAGLRAMNHRVDILARRVAHLTAATAVAIPSAWPRLRGAERRIENQARRLTRLEKGTMAAVGAGIVGAALARLGLGWTRCRNVNKVGKQVCGMDADLLASLLGSSLLLVSAISIEQLARELREPTELVTDALHGLIKEF